MEANETTEAVQPGDSGGAASGTYTVSLTEAEAAFIERPLVGAGGFQLLLGRLREGLRHPAAGEWTLTLGLTDARRVAKYADGYGDGGYQTRLRPIAQKIKDLLPPDGQEELDL